MQCLIQPHPTHLAHRATSLSTPGLCPYSEGSIIMGALAYSLLFQEQVILKQIQTLPKGFLNAFLFPFVKIEMHRFRLKKTNKSQTLLHRLLSIFPYPKWTLWWFGKLLYNLPILIWSYETDSSLNVSICGISHLLSELSLTSQARDKGRSLNFDGSSFGQWNG